MLNAILNKLIDQRTSLIESISEVMDETGAILDFAKSWRPDLNVTYEDVRDTFLEVIPDDAPVNQYGVIDYTYSKDFGVLAGVSADTSFHPIITISSKPQNRNPHKAVVQVLLQFKCDVITDYTYTGFVYSGVFDLVNGVTEASQSMSHVDVYTLQGNVISIDKFLNQFNETLDLSLFIRTACERAKIGPISVNDIKREYDKYGVGSSDAVANVIDACASVKSPDEKLSPLEWISFLEEIIKQFATVNTDVDEIEFAEMPKFAPVAWSLIVEGVFSAMSAILGAVQTVWTQVFAAVTGAVSYAFSAITNMNVGGEVAINWDSPNTMFNSFSAQGSTNSSDLYYYTFTRKQGTTIVTTPFFNRFLWCSNSSSDVVNYELWPKACLSREGVKKVLRIFHISLNEDLTLASNVIPVNGGYIDTSITPKNQAFNYILTNVVNEDLMGFFTDCAEIGDPMVMLRLAFWNYALGTMLSTKDTYNTIRTPFYAQSYNQWIDRLNNQASNLNWPQFIGSIVKAFPMGTVSDVMFLVQLISEAGRTGKVQGVQTPLKELLFFDQTWDGYSTTPYPGDEDNTLNDVRHGEALVRNQPFVVWPKFDGLYTVIATAGIMLAASIAAVGVTIAKKKVTLKLKSKAIARRNKLAADYSTVQMAASDYNAGRITFAEYDAIVKPYLKDVRKYNRWAGWTGMAKVNDINPAWTVPVGAPASESGSSADINPILRLINPNAV